MKPDWDKLASDFSDSKEILIGDVDCTAAGKALCEKHGVKGYPTILSFGPGDEDGEKYEGGRDFASLKKHAESLGPSCSADMLDKCSPEQRQMLDKFMGMSQQRRDAKLVKLRNAMKKVCAQWSPQPPVA